MVEEGSVLEQSGIDSEAALRAKDIEDDFAKYDQKRANLPPEVTAVIPEGWGWFASVMNPGKLDIETMESRGLVINPDSSDAQFYPPAGTKYVDIPADKRASSIFWTTPMRTLGDYYTYAGHTGMAEVIILAPKKYLLEAGDDVGFKVREGATAFYKGVFPLIATQAVTIDQGRFNKENIMQRYFVVPEALRGEYDQILQRGDRSVTEVAPGRIINPRPEKYVPYRPPTWKGKLVSAAARLLPRIGK